MDALAEPRNQENITKQSETPTGYIAIGLRQTDRGPRMVRLFTTDTLPPEYQEEAPIVPAIRQSV